MDQDKQTPASNSLHEQPNGVIELQQTGYQTVKSAGQFIPQIDNFVKKCRAEHRPALIIADISGVTGHDASVRDLALELLKSDFDAMAIVTAANITARLIGNWLVKVVGTGNRVQFFEDKDKATEWLHTGR